MSSQPGAVLQCVVGIAALTAMDALVKFLALSHPVEVVTLARYASGAGIALLVWAAQGWTSGGRSPLRPDMWRAHLLRGGLISISGFSFFWAISKLPLAEALTIAFVAPLLVPPLARVFLGEAIRPRAAIGGFIGFCGVLVAVQGGGGTAEGSGDARLMAIGAALLAAAAYAGTAVILRARAGRDGATVITLLGAVVPALILSPVAIGQPIINGVDMLWFAGLGLIGNIGVQLLARAYAHLEAQVGAVMEFSALPWAALFGWFIFGEPVQLMTIVGAAVIMLAVLVASTSSRAKSPRAKLGQPVSVKPADLPPSL